MEKYGYPCLSLIKMVVLIKQKSSLLFHLTITNPFRTKLRLFSSKHKVLKKITNLHSSQPCGGHISQQCCILNYYGIAITIKLHPKKKHTKIHKRFSLYHIHTHIQTNNTH